jgi:hypothetical protein
MISLEKKIETLHITRSSTEKTQQLADESMEVSRHIERVTRLSSLALLLYRWYVIHGHSRNEAEEKDIKLFFKNYLPANLEKCQDFMKNFISTKVIAGMISSGRISELLPLRTEMGGPVCGTSTDGFHRNRSLRERPACTSELAFYAKEFSCF